MASEIEVKLIATEEKVQSVKQVTFSQVVNMSPWRVRRLKNTYFDTPSLGLRESRIGLRIRDDGEKLIQTVKSSGKAVGGLHERNESEATLSKMGINIDIVDDPYLKILLEDALEEDEQFIPIFTTNFVREQAELTFEDGTVIEIALDLGNIEVGDAASPISEVELELKEGDAVHLFALSRQLISECGFSLSNASKARRGYRLCNTASAMDRRMPMTELTPSMEAETAFEIICYTGFKHWQYYKQFLNSDESPQAILQMSRALGYVQHVYHTFGNIIPRSATSDLRANWEWMSEFMLPLITVARQTLYLERMKTFDLDGQTTFSGLHKKKYQELKKEISRFKAVQSSERYNLIMLSFSEWLFFKRWRTFIRSRDESLLKSPILPFAKAQLDHMLKELKRNLNGKKSLTKEEYINNLSLLYRSLDDGLFFGALFDASKQQSYRQSWLDFLAAIRELEYNDFVADHLIESGLKTEEEAELWLQEQQENALLSLENRRQNIFKNKSFWKN